MQPRPALYTALYTALCLSALLLSASVEGLEESAVELRVEKLFSEGKLVEARALALTLQGTASGTFLLGRVALEEGDPAEACRWLDRAVEQRPGDAELLFWAGRAHGARARKETSRLRQASAARKARGLFEDALAENPDHLGARLALVRFHLDAPALVGGSRAEARRQAEELARRNAHAGFRAWAAIYEKEEKWDQAIAAYGAAIESLPGDEEPYLRLIWLHQRRTRFADALRVAQQLLDAIPDSVLGEYEAGRTAAFSGLQLERGKEALGKYLRYRPRPTEPSLALAHFHLGMIFRHEGRDDLAGAQFRRALTLDPQFEEARRNLAEVGG